MFSDFLLFINKCVMCEIVEGKRENEVETVQETWSRAKGLKRIFHASLMIAFEFKVGGILHLFVRIMTGSCY